jgi:hypothetical protein
MRTIVYRVETAQSSLQQNEEDCGRREEIAEVSNKAVRALLNKDDIINIFLSRKLLKIHF